MRWTGLISCEHAQNGVPNGLELGVGRDVLDSHVAWDPGAEAVATLLSERFDLPLFAGRYTRLVADLNRSPDNPEVVPHPAFGVDVPGNADLSPDDVATRIAAYHTPYWSDVMAACDQGLKSGRVLHVSVHSFAEHYGDEPRELDVGLLVDLRRPIEQHITPRLQDTLEAAGLDARVNEPYDGLDDAIIVNLRRRYPSDRYAAVEFEVNQRHADNVGPIAEAIGDALQRLVLW